MSEFDPTLGLNSDMNSRMRVGVNELPLKRHGGKEVENCVHDTLDPPTEVPGLDPLTFVDFGAVAVLHYEDPLRRKLRVDARHVDKRRERGRSTEVLNGLL